MSAQRSGCALRVRCALTSDGARGAGSRVELRRYPKAHPFASLSGSDNMMSFTTKRCAGGKRLTVAPRMHLLARPP